MSHSFIDYPSSGPDQGIVKDLAPAADPGTAADAIDGSLKRLYRRAAFNGVTTVGTNGRNATSMGGRLNSADAVDAPKDVAGTYRVPHFAKWGTNRIKLRYAGLGDGRPIVNPFTITGASIEVIRNGSPLLVQLMFGGQSSVTVNPGATIETDYVDVYVPPGGKFWSRTAYASINANGWLIGSRNDTTNYPSSDWGIVRNNYLGDAAYTGACRAGSTSTTIVLDANAVAIDGFYNYCDLEITGGTGVGQVVTLNWYGSGYNGTTKSSGIFGTWTTTPDATSTYAIRASVAGLARAATSSTITFSPAANRTTGMYVGQSLTIASGTGVGQTVKITAYNVTTRVANIFPNWTVTPDTTSEYRISIDYSQNASFTPPPPNVNNNASSGITNSEEFACPQAILGVPVSRGPTVCVLGDSITSEVYGSSSTVRRWLETLYPWVHSSQPNEALSHRADGLVFLEANVSSPRLGAMVGCTHAICQHGTNDMRGGTGATELKTGMLLLWQMLVARGIRPYQMTITPLTNSTDNWSTTTNQTFNNNSQVVLADVNDYIRSLPAPLCGVIDVSDVVSSARNSGLWKPNYTADGVHPNSTAQTAIVSMLTAIPAFTLD